MVAAPNEANGMGASDVFHPAMPTPAATSMHGMPPSPAAARLLGELLALDLSNLTPLQALIRLHQLQETARRNVPWQAWLADLAGGNGTARQPDWTALQPGGVGHLPDATAEQSDVPAWRSNGRAGRP